MSEADHYAVLGVDPTASSDDIKTAFKRKTLKEHPDRNPGDPGASERFRLVVEAHRVLSDPLLRSKYDRGRFPSRGGGRAMEDLVENLFRNFSRRTGPAAPDGIPDPDPGPPPHAPAPERDPVSRRGPDAKNTIWITLEEAAFGTQHEVNVPTTGQCDRCEGRGGEPGSRTLPCMTCSGNGEVLMGTRIRVCSNCKGRRTVAVKVCSSCGGKGTRSITRKVNIRIPPGVEDGTELRVAGGGGQGPAGPGDLYATVRLREHPDVVRDGKDLRVRAEVPFRTAMLGGRVPVTYVGRTVEVEVSPGAAMRGEVVTVKGAGIRSALGRPSGDLHVTLRAAVPERLSARAVKLVEELDEELSRRR